MKFIFIKIILIFILIIILFFNYNFLSIDKSGVKFIKNYGDISITKAIHAALNVQNCYYFKIFDIYLLTITLDDGIIIFKVEETIIELLKKTSIIYPRIYPHEIDFIPLWIYII